MATAKLSLKELTIEEKTQLATTIHKAMTGNALFTTPSPTLNSLLMMTVGVTSAVADAEKARNDSKIATLEQDEAEADLDRMLTQLAAYVDNIANGNADTILASGMQTKSAAEATGPLPAPGAIQPTLGDFPGEIDLSWPGMRGAKSFIVQIATANEPVEADWKLALVSTKSRCTVKGLSTDHR